MIAPLLDTPSGLLAIPIGMVFGATLERAGLGSPHTYVEQFRGRDFTIVKVMFAAIVTAMLGVFWAARIGVLDLSRVAMPATDVVPQLIGAVLFGAGFAIASLCPGSACVAAGRGTRDGIATIGGLFAGTLVVSLAWERLGAVAEHAPREGATLASDFGVSTGVVVALITFMALGVFWLVDRATRHRSPRWAAPVAIAAGAVALLGATSSPAASASVSVQQLQRIGAEIDRESDHVDAITLADWIRTGKVRLRILDVREQLTPRDYRIPGAEDVPVSQIPLVTIAPSDTVVLYSDGGGHAAQAWVMLRLRGISHVYLLRDGLQSWDDEILAPRRPLAPDSATASRYQHQLELALWFGGVPSVEPGNARATPAGTDSAPPRRRRAC